MAFRPEFIAMITEAADEPRLPDDPHSIHVAEAATQFLARLAHMTGKGIVPGTPPVPSFTIRIPTMEERAARRLARRQAAQATSGTAEPLPAGEAEVQQE